MREVLQAAAATTPQLIHHVVGLDLGDRWSRYCVLDESGTAVEEDWIRTSVAGIEKRFSGKPPLRIVLEAGTHSPWVSRLLESYQHQVVVANPRKVRLIYESDRKNDRLDARMLARLGRLDVNLLAPVRHAAPRLRRIWRWCAAGTRWWPRARNRSTPCAGP